MTTTTCPAATCPDCTDAYLTCRKHSAELFAAAEQHDMGNNETVTTGVVPQADGTFLALTFSQSKSFKTRNGAAKWFARKTGK